MPRKAKQSIYSEFVGEEPGKNSKLTNLLKTPQKDTPENSPRILNSVKNGTHMADVLYLPQDADQSKYALVVVDMATGITDAEPLKAHSAEATIKAMTKIYARKILKAPKVLQVDDGTEFKGDFPAFLEKLGIALQVAKTGRSRQMGKVEGRNKVLGKMIHQLQLAAEINTGEQVTDWTSELPRAVTLINKHFAKPVDDSYLEKEPRCEGGACNLLEQGTKVRIILDKPTDYLSSKRQHGTFRASDIRWDPKIRTIEQFILTPDQPPMYKVSGVDNALYTKNQLQVVAENEEAPSTKYQKKFVAEKILDKKKVSNRVNYLIQWEDKSVEPSWEPRTTLIKEIPDMIKEFEKVKKVPPKAEAPKIEAPKVEPPKSERPKRTGKKVTFAEPIVSPVKEIKLKEKARKKYEESKKPQPVPTRIQPSRTGKKKP